MRRRLMVMDAPVAVDQAMDQGAPDQIPAQVLDQRETERHPLSLPASVSVAGSPNEVYQGEIRNVSGGGTQLVLDRPVTLASLLRVEYDDNLLLGEVIYCQQERSGYLVGIRIEHGLFGLKALSDAMEKF